MQVRKVRLTIEYDPDWANIYHAEIPVALAQEREAWINGDVTLQDVMQSLTPHTVTIEVVP